jgi:hypothetical protein
VSGLSSRHQLGALDLASAQRSLASLVTSLGSAAGFPRSRARWAQPAFGRLHLMRGWQSTAGTLPLRPMPPSAHHYSVGSTRARANRSFDTDAQGRPPLRGSCSLVAGQLQR